jgi:hypothetical protein
MLIAHTPRQCSDRSERHAYQITLALGEASRRIDELTFERDLARAELADVRAQWSADRETIANLGLDSCETDTVVHCAVLSERQAWLMAECAKVTGLFDAPMLERVMEFYLRHHETCEGKGRAA